MSLESRNKQRINQASADRIDKLIQEAEQRNLLPPPSFAVGSQDGKIRVVTVGQGETTVDPITNGGIAKGDRVRNQGGFADAMPHVQTRTQSSPVEPGKVKILCFKDGGLWIGGDRPNPKRIYTIPEGARLDFDLSRIVNKGDGDKWIVTFVLIGNDRTGIVVLQSGVGTLWEIWMDDPRLSSLAGPRPVLWTQTGLWTLFSGSGDDTTFIYAGEVYGSLGESPLNYINGRPDFVDPKAGTAIYTRSIGLDIQVLFWDGATETEVPLLESFPLGAPTFIKDTLYSCLTEGKTATITKISLPSGDTSTRKTKVFPVPSGYTRLDVGFHP